MNNLDHRGEEAWKARMSIIGFCNNWPFRMHPTCTLSLTCPTRRP